MLCFNMHIEIAVLKAWAMGLCPYSTYSVSSPLMLHRMGIDVNVHQHQLASRQAA